MNMSPRAIALVTGAKSYYTGQPCKHGHVTNRSVGNGTCHGCIAILGRVWYKNNKHRKNSSTRLWYKNNKNRRNAKSRAWRVNNSERICVYTRTYRSLKRAATGTHAIEDVLILLERQQNICAGPICHVNISDRYHVDHKTPLSRGGSNWPRNLQLLCPRCNISKGAKTQREWHRSLRL